MVDRFLRMPDRLTPSSLLENRSRFSGLAAGALLETRFRRITLWTVIALLYALTALYHGLTALVQFPADTMTGAIYSVVLISCYGLLFFALSVRFAQQRPSVLKVFWRSTLYAAVLFGLLRFVPELANPGSFRAETGIPQDLQSVVRTVVLSPLIVLFGMGLLFRFRELVMFKRTRRIVRQWYAMIAAMVVASFALNGADPSLGINTVAAIFLGLAIALMVVNSFRLSRIVYLSLKEKASTIGLSIVLLVILILAVTSSTSGLFPGRSHVFLWTYSPGLNLFALQCVLFGILYCITASLSLLFHLPTTGEFQQKAGELAAMHSVARLTGEMLNRDMMMRTIVGSPVEAGMCSTAWLALADPRTGSLRPKIVATRNTTPERVNDLFDVDALYDDAAGRKEPVVLNHAAVDHRVRARPGDGISSLLVVPLLMRKTVLGALFVAKDISHGFENDDVDAVKTFAHQAAMAVDNARLLEEQIEKERLSRELVIAREVQRKLLPQTLPVAEGVTVAASSVSAQEVGGDYYDFLEVAEGTWAFIVGDVSGKGTSAAFYMAELKGIFRALSGLTESPRVFLEHANRALVNSMEKNVFISVVYGVLDLKRAEFTLARAGHCPAIFVNGDGSSRYLRTQGLGLGLDRGRLFSQVLEAETVKLSTGDTFVLYTDGVVESRSGAGEEYGYDRLMDAVCEHHAKPVEDIHSALLADLNRFLGEKAYDDDMTLLVVKWDGSETDRTQGAYARASEQTIPNQT